VMWRRNNRSGKPGELKRDPQVAQLLRQLAPQRDLLSWSAVQRLVASAPPVRTSWFNTLVLSGARPLRYSLATLLLLGFGTGLLALLPAQSDVVGTTVLTELPGVWPVGSPEFTEVESEAQALFNALALPQSDMFIKVGPAHGRQELAFALLGVSQTQAQQFYGALAGKFPALRVIKPAYSAIDTDRVGSRLNELVLGMVKPQELKRLSTGEMKGYLLKSLKQCGFDDIRIKVVRGADGTTYIEVDARMKFAVTGRTQEELERSGLTQQVLGGQAYRELLKQAGVPNPE
jgi:hypothetical protein